MLPILGPILELFNTVAEKVAPDADTAMKMKTQLAEAAMKGEFDIQLAQINAVNTTMQAESKSEHWMQWAWRPTVGFTFAAVIINNYILGSYFGSFSWWKHIEVPSRVWESILVVLGAAAVTRGIQKIKNK